MGLETVPAGKALPDDIYVVIEIPANSDQLNMKWIKKVARCLLTVLWRQRCSIQRTMVM